MHDLIRGLITGRVATDVNVQNAWHCGLERSTLAWNEADICRILRRLHPIHLRVESGRFQGAPHCLEERKLSGAWETFNRVHEQCRNRLRETDVRQSMNFLGLDLV
jgi:hypothetical protein